MGIAATPDTVTAGSAAGRSRLRWALAALCVTVTTSYGVLFYAFPVLMVSINADTGWSIPALTAAFSGGQVVAALSGLAVGRWLDRSGPRPVMTTGSLLAVPTLVGLALAPSLPWFFAAWIAAGAPMAMLFYPPAFAAITRWYGPHRVRALTALTLAAGFASTIFAPLTATLETHLGWRWTLLVLAGVLAVVTIPPHVFLLRPAWPRVANPGGADPGGNVRSVVGSRAFLTLMGAMALGAFTIYAVVFAVPPLFQERGFGAQTAAWALGLGGVGQVVGRFGYPLLANRTNYVTRTVVILLVGAFTTALLGALPGPATLLLGAALLAGVARGVFTLVEATAVSDRWGATRYATLNGILHVPLVSLMALAPWGGAVLALLLGGYPPLFLALAGLGLVAAALATATRPR